MVAVLLLGVLPMQMERVLISRPMVYHSFRGSVDLNRMFKKRVVKRNWTDHVVTLLWLPAHLQVRA